MKLFLYSILILLILVAIGLTIILCVPSLVTETLPELMSFAAGYITAL
nr:MAG TPA: hypothetical protein [Caudoviricetes sp.]DAS44982.1 MAG TPA: hypothetical protein [Caudoviricetes sp.]